MTLEKEYESRNDILEQKINLMVTLDKKEKNLEMYMLTSFFGDENSKKKDWKPITLFQ